MFGGGGEGGALLLSPERAELPELGQAFLGPLGAWELMSRRVEDRGSCWGPVARELGRPWWIWLRTTYKFKFGYCLAPPRLELLLSLPLVATLNLWAPGRGELAASLGQAGVGGEPQCDGASGGPRLADQVPACSEPCFPLCPCPLCRLALYVYEYLLHVGAQKSAQTFLSEVSGTPRPPASSLTPGLPPPPLREPLFSGAATVATILNFYHLLAFIVSWSSVPFGWGAALCARLL